MILLKFLRIKNKNLQLFCKNLLTFSVFGVIINLRNEKGQGKALMVVIMKNFEIYFCSNKYGEKPEAWEQKMLIEAETKKEAWEIFKQKTGVFSGNDLDYLDIKEVA